ncbi:helix-turn-helix domain-containing protein [Amycolatopsis nivea]
MADQTCPPAITEAKAVDTAGVDSDDSLLLRVEDAARLLSIGRTRVYDLIRLGLLDSVKVFGARRIPRAAVEKYVQNLIKEAA